MFNFDWLSQLPLTSAKAVFLVLFLAIAFLISRLPRSYLTPKSGPAPIWSDLRLWAYALMLMMACLYYLF